MTAPKPAPLTPQQVETLKHLDFPTRPVQLCVSLLSPRRCPRPAFHIATSRCCGRQYDVCDDHATAMTHTVLRFVCRHCQCVAPLHDLFRLSPIGDRL